MKEPSILASMNAQPEPQGCNSISFIIPAWNEEAFVGATLAALRVATTSLSVPFEIIVVDDGSTDRTAQIAEAQGAQVVKVNYRRIAAACNVGAHVARGAIFDFIDADTVVASVMLGRFWRLFVRVPLEAAAPSNWMVLLQSWHVWVCSLKIL